jgi:transcriptional regulator with XRE-family HTH domain
MQNKKLPNPVDVQVGARIRIARRAAKVSQAKLGEAIGITFQQVQKYEKGTNRVGSSRMHQIGQVLGQPVSFFFEDSETQGESTPSDVNESLRFLATNEGKSLVSAFRVIESAKVRKAFVDLIQATASA